MLTEKLAASGEYVLEELTGLANIVYNHDDLLEELNYSISIKFPKISGTSKCEKYHTISLMSNVTCGDDQCAWQNVTRNNTRTIWFCT